MKLAKFLGKKHGKSTESPAMQQASNGSGAGPSAADVPPDVAKQLGMISLTAQDFAAVSQFKPMVENNIEYIVTAFYDTVTHVDELKEIILTHSTLDRLKKTLKIHVIEMFEEKIDEAFIAKRNRIAEAHVRIGLAPKWYIAAFQNLQNALLDTMLRENPGTARLSDFIKLITKLLNFEQQLVLEAYQKGEEEKREEIYKKAREDTKREILYVSSELAALTEELHSSIESMSAYGREVNHSVDHSVQSSLSLRETALSGSRQVRELGVLMVSLNGKFDRMEQVLRQLNEFSGRISEISGAVMDIASQTHLLSLNAAIEAARAGEQGRGFSVVATEVRKLSKETTRTISGIAQVIEDSMRQARQASDSVAEVQRFAAEGEEKSAATQNAFGEIVTAIDRSMGQVRGAEKKMHELLHVIDEIDAAARKVAESADHLYQTANSI